LSHFIPLLLHLGYYIRTDQLPELGPWTYLLLAVLVAIEGPFATLLGAAAASAHLLRPGLVFVSAAAGNLTADSLWYLLGFLGKSNWIFRMGKKLGVKAEFLERLEKVLRKHSLRILFMAKLTLSFIIPSLIAAGLIRIPWKRWFPAIFAGEMIWTGTLVLIGYFTTEALKRIELGIGYLAVGFSVALVGFLLWLAHRYLTREYENEVEITEADLK
jgi:membrane protein DedA with SNARE-associated domain